MTAAQTALERVQALLKHGQEFGNTSVVVNVDDLAAVLAQGRPAPVAPDTSEDGQWAVVADRARGDYLEAGDGKTGDRVTYSRSSAAACASSASSVRSASSRPAPAELTLTSMPIGTQFWMRYRAEFTSTPDRWYQWVRVRRRILCISDPLAGASFTLREAERDFDPSTIRGLEKPWPKPDQLDHGCGSSSTNGSGTWSPLVSIAAKNNQGDYWRWQGHMEARRQLASQLGWTVPHEFGDHTGPQHHAVVLASVGGPREDADDVTGGRK